MRKLGSVVLLLGLLACNGSLPQGGLKTGLEGYMLYGPTKPVCQVDDPCEDLPFSANFTALQGGKPAARFGSDRAGYFKVLLPPGTYAVVPDEDSGIITPSAQAKAVEVGPTGLTQVRLSFDTGIR